jgi:hypothetical protein
MRRSIRAPKQNLQGLDCMRDGSDVPRPVGIHQTSPQSIGILAPLGGVPHRLIPALSL